MALLRLNLAVSILAFLVDATPVIDYPINAQVPPVARISQPFSYSFSSSTFSSTSPITYSLSGGPAWLSLDSSRRTISGTPNRSDIGSDVVTGVPIDITATDATGSVTLDATLVISTNPAPVVRIPTTNQLSSLENFVAPSKLLYHPSTPFSFNFDAETFLDNATGLNYYAVSQNNTPLPSWVTFNSESLSFSGETPDAQSLIQPPQVFGFRLVASDVEGFLGASVTFEIEVGIHLFAFSDAALQINATTGDDITFDGLSNNLQLDGTSPNSSSLLSVIATTPSWLTFNNKTLSLTGVAPTESTTYNVTVQATDIYGDVANASVYIEIQAEIFSGQIGPLNATIGEPFSFSFGDYLTNSSDVNLTAQLSPSTQWLSFDSANFTLAGQVPANIEETNVNVTLVAVSRSTNRSASESFELSIITAPVQSTTSALPSSTSSLSSSLTASATSTNEAIPAKARKGLSAGIIAAIVVPIAVVFIAIIACICFCLWRRSRSRRRPGSPSKSDISAPIEARSSDDAHASTTSHTQLPEKLRAETSGFVVDRSSTRYTYLPRGGIKRNFDGTIRRSQTMSIISDVQEPPDIRDSQSSTNKWRSYSENALSKTEGSWRSTQGSSSNQDSAYPMIGSRSSSSNVVGPSNNYSIIRHYSNYSRKGRARRSTYRGSAENYPRDSNHSLRPATGHSILNMADTSISSTPLDNFSVPSDQSSVQQTPEIAYKAGRPTREVDSSKRYSRFFPGDRRISGVGHGARESMSQSIENFTKRRSVGHGRDWIPTAGSSGAFSHELARDPTWKNLHLSDDSNANYRGSAASNMTVSTDLLYPGDQQRMSIKQVPVSPVASSFVELSGSSITSRPRSRRTIGESPFFGGGGSSRFSRKSSRKLKERLYNPSSIVLEEQTASSQQDLEESIMHSLRRQSDAPRDSFGISYGTAREGTERLRSFVNTRLGRTGTQNSMTSNMSRDSRFESANPSAYSHDPEIPGSRDGVMIEDEDWEDYLPEEYSEESWEQHYSPHRDSRGNIIEYAAEDSSPHLELAAEQAAVKPQVLRQDNEAMHLTDIGPNARVVPGAGRRPVSVGTNWKRESSQSADHIEQEDYKTYI
ncbi:polarity establishment cellular polarization protein [Phlyctema vagabunda]|uniref:Polarity establishment cellular polarization protein n=1 Tax=Phlyctema vagabunda TaxID=108571 RepID=A0ABR4PM05_9HELO